VVIGVIEAVVPVLSAYTDSELLAAIRNNDEKAFSELFKRYWRGVHSMAYSKVRSKEVTEEIVQDLFTSLWDKRHSLSINHVPSYLFAAVKNRALNYIESLAVHKKYWDYSRKYLPHQEDATDAAVGFNELMAAIEEGIDHLPEKSKKVFMLNRLEGRSVHEIALNLHLSDKAIQYHLTQSLKKLRLHLKHFFLTSGISLSLLFLYDQEWVCWVGLA
jgi:RNA polymerase sigma-70 factor (family 1)